MFLHRIALLTAALAFAPIAAIASPAVDQPAPRNCRRQDAGSK